MDESEYENELDQGSDASADTSGWGTGDTGTSAADTSAMNTGNEETNGEDTGGRAASGSDASGSDASATATSGTSTDEEDQPQEPADNPDLGQSLFNGGETDQEDPSNTQTEHAHDSGDTDSGGDAGSGDTPSAGTDDGGGSSDGAGDSAMWISASVSEGRKGDDLSFSWGGVPEGATLKLANGFGAWDVAGAGVSDWHLVAPSGTEQTFTLTASDGTTASCSVAVKLLRRNLVWCVWYDWWDKGGNKGDHQGAADNGVAKAFKAVDDKISHELVWLYGPDEFARFTGQHADHDRLLAVVFLGSFPWWETWPLDKVKELNALKAFIRETDVPILGFCGGHQLVTKAFTGDKEIVEGQDRAKRHVEHCYPSLDKFVDGAPKVVGDRDFPSSGELHTQHGADMEENFFEEDGQLKPMTLTAAGKIDPIYEGIVSSPPSFLLWHHDWVRAPHPDFVELAQSDFWVTAVGSTIAVNKGKNQSLKHRSKLIYTSQFHPEQDYKPQAKGNKSGGRYLQNFFKLAIKYWDDRDGA